jgi:hypothetical protein
VPATLIGGGIAVTRSGFQETVIGVIQPAAEIRRHLGRILRQASAAEKLLA